MTTAERLHLDAVAGLGCIICGAPAEIHHLKRHPETGRHLGMGQRASHFHVIPLCPLHHRQGGQGVSYHAGPRAWEAIHGTEAELWRRVEDMLRRVA
jgi:hypothetical protein